MTQKPFMKRPPTAEECDLEIGKNEELISEIIKLQTKLHLKLSNPHLVAVSLRRIGDGIALNLKDTSYPNREFIEVTT